MDDFARFKAAREARAVTLGKCCETCQFFDHHWFSYSGVCRVAGPARGAEKWPRVEHDDLCGRWKEIETAEA